MRFKQTVSFIMSLSMICFFICACGSNKDTSSVISDDSSRLEETIIEEITLSEDLVVKQTSSNGVEDYYIYDDNKNLEYELMVDENKDS